jgi:hypothetical protein
VIEGFEFLAKIEYLSDGKSVLFHTVPGTATKVDERFRELTPATCEHCKKVRRRTETFVVREVATDKQMQVGRNCLADYTGIATPEKIAAAAQWIGSFVSLRDEIDGWYEKHHFAELLDAHHVLALTSAYIAKFGWTPKSAGNGGATANSVAEHFWLTTTFLKEKERLAMKAMGEMAELPEHQERARKVVEWVKTLEPRNDYLQNLKTLVTLELIEHRHLGIVCSAVAAYQRAMNLKVEYANKKKATEGSEFVGEVGKRLRGIKAKVHFVRAMEAGAWGPSTLVKFLTEDGNLLTWFASGDKDYDVGTEVTLDGTVKRHHEYNGTKETQLTRAVVKEATNA